MPEVQQAGAIAVKAGDDGTPVFLMVTSRRNPELWIFPKGHVEAGETAADAALRELKEEAGVVGRLVTEIGASTFQDRGRDIRVRYFVARALSQEAAGEGRRIAWLRVEDARKQAGFEALRGLLDEAVAALSGAGRA